MTVVVMLVIPWSDVALVVLSTLIAVESVAVKVVNDGELLVLDVEMAVVVVVVVLVTLSDNIMLKHYLTDLNKYLSDILKSTVAQGIYTNFNHDSDDI